MTSIVQVAERLHSEAEAWDLKAYVLGALFYRFISEDLCDYLNREEREAGNIAFDYASLSDAEAEYGRQATVEEKGYFLLPSQLFARVQATANSEENLNEILNRTFASITSSARGTSSEHAFDGLFDSFDPNSQALGDTVAKRNQRLAKLLIDIGSHQMLDAAASFDELLRYYVTIAGKKGGDHFTPPSIAQLVARLAAAGNPAAGAIYDPAFGSGSLLIECNKRLSDSASSSRVLGQELVLTNFNMARMNLMLHGIGFDHFDLAGGASTLTDPTHASDELFDIIVSNPKWSASWPGDKDPLLISDPRFAPAGVLAPKQYHDLGFTMHAASQLAPGGIAVLVQSLGTLYRGKAEAKLRGYLVESNLVDTVIQLPPDWGYGVTVPGCVVVLRRAKRDDAILFIDASREFERVDSKNELLESHQRKILDAFLSRADIDHFSRLATREEVQAEGFNLSVSNYVEPQSNAQTINIRLLNAEITGIVRTQTILREEIDAIVAELEGSDA